jgi:uncharacterized protein YbcV (DUF1398 family)
MFNAEAIRQCALRARNYPELALSFLRLGMHSYTVDVASHATLYRSLDGEIVQLPGQPGVPVSAPFNAEAVLAALRRNQRGESDYPGFMQDIHAAGVKRYEALLTGARPRCIYFGSANGVDGRLEEPIHYPSAS